MIRAVLVEDEQAGIENLRALLARYCPQVKIVSEATNPLDAKIDIHALKPDLIFLDVEMPFGTGFDLLASYERIDFEVIFVTAFEQYALKALHFSACDYLLKPIEISELVAAVAKAQERIDAKQQNLHLRNLLENLKLGKAERKIALPTSTGTLFIKLSDIIRCEAEGGYTWFHFASRKKILVTKNLGEYEELLSDRGFIRVHHHHLLNHHHITELKKTKSPVAVMTDGSSVTVSQRKREALLELLRNS